MFHSALKFCFSQNKYVLLGSETTLLIVCWYLAYFSVYVWMNYRTSLSPFPPFPLWIVKYFWDTILILTLCALNAYFKKFNFALLLIQCLGDVVTTAGVFLKELRLTLAHLAIFMTWCSFCCLKSFSYSLFTVLLLSSWLVSSPFPLPVPLHLFSFLCENALGPSPRISSFLCLYSFPRGPSSFMTLNE